MDVQEQAEDGEEVGEEVWGEGSAEGQEEMSDWDRAYAIAEGRKRAHEEEWEKFREIIRGRVVCLVLHGWSLGELEDRVGEFSEYDCCWGTVNRACIAEAVLLKGFIKIEYVVAYCKDYEGVEYGVYTLRRAAGRGNTLMEFLYQCREHGVGRVVLFGADGYSDNGYPYYKMGVGPKAVAGHKADCSFLNEFYDERKGPRVVNCSPGSKYKVFKAIGYDEVGGYLCGEGW